MRPGAGGGVYSRANHLHKNPGSAKHIPGCEQTLGWVRERMSGAFATLGQEQLQQVRVYLPGLRHFAQTPVLSREHVLGFLLRTRGPSWQLTTIEDVLGDPSDLPFPGPWLKPCGSTWFLPGGVAYNYDI